MATHEILSRHLREVPLNDYEWQFVWTEDFPATKGCWPAQGLLPDVDINIEPEEYIRQRLEALEFPESYNYDSDISSGENSGSDSDRQ